MNEPITIRLRSDNPENICTHCGGNKRIQVMVTGNHEIDFIPCPTCKGRGVKQHFRNCTPLQALTQHWRKEF